MDAQFSEDHKGSRWSYGFRNRPPGYAHCPKGYLVGSEKKHSDFNFGTLDYPEPLSAEEIYRYELTFVGACITSDDLDFKVVYPSQTLWRFERTLIAAFPDRAELWAVDLSKNSDNLHALVPYPQFNGSLDL